MREYNILDFIITADQARTETKKNIDLLNHSLYLAIIDIKRAVAKGYYVVSIPVSSLEITDEWKLDGLSKKLEGLGYKVSYTDCNGDITICWKKFEE